ncbi:hypothetical protein [Variovorax brevis]|uniref:hypothetical protein n=1 Tax=Variovorax brevis TaxID=3053503 RepID=UPI003365AF32
MKRNADGSLTLYVGPRAPEGWASNLVPRSTASYCHALLRAHRRHQQEALELTDRVTDPCRPLTCALGHARFLKAGDLLTRFSAPAS